ncbi:methylated-DNA--[protein]-cysteine S-methyltransferase [Helicobacter mesocricetorum]|uniref:methylated-DNA--[protein]-cysteine S-methyltransferase n=1 Tax=Helicobacter mesocricetorum TaxID=87012 RepID=UPI000CF11A88|nr:methylated-DNA--[protein]-cysteine S-methyltransferase [Helicobacter mesocricetorum]
MDKEEKLQAIKRDKSYNGKFYYAVKSTGIVCYPSCSSKQPLEKIAFYDTLEESLTQGFNPYEICMKTLHKDKNPKTIYYQSICDSPIGKITLACDNKENLVGLWLEGQKYFGNTLKGKRVMNDELKIFKKTKKWLERYFRGKKPKISELPLTPIGSAFQQNIWQTLCMIPYGEVCTYGDIAKELAHQRGIAKMSAQAVGNAVGRNPISLIIPCHRVIGSNGKLTGYAGGLERKEWLLDLERSSKV